MERDCLLAKESRWEARCRKPAHIMQFVHLLPIRALAIVVMKFIIATKRQKVVISNARFHA